MSLHSYCNLLADKLTDLQRYSARQHITRLVDSHFESAQLKELNELVGELLSRSQVPLEQAAARYVSSTENKMGHVSSCLAKVKFEEEVSKIVKHMGTIIKPMRSVGYKWSEHKAQKITINDMIAVQTTSGSNGERFALL